MKKEEIKVKVINSDHALQLRYVLETFGESISEWDFKFYSEMPMYLIFGGHDWMLTNIEHVKLNEFKEVTAAQFINLISTQVVENKVILISEDGKSMCVGDTYYRAELISNKWRLSIWNGDVYTTTLQPTDFVVHSPGLAKAFSTKKSAEYWIDQKNKPKEIVINFGATCRAVVKERGIDIMVFEPKNFCFFLSTEHLRQLNESHSSLQTV